MADCVQYRKDTNPCSPTYDTYRLFEAPCPPVFTEDATGLIGNDFILYVNNTINENFTIEIINQLNEKLVITISVEPQINEIYLKEGTYRICFYSLSPNNYGLKRVDNNQTIFINSCRDNIVVNQNINYNIDYL